MEFKKIWNDPVWSKVISAVIIAAGTLTLTFILSLISKRSFFDPLIIFLTSNIPVWIFIIIIIAFLFLFKINGKWTRKFKYDVDTLRMDKETFNTFRKTLPQTESINSLRYFHSSLGFTWESISDLDNFEDLSRQSDFEFFNPELEKKKNELATKVSDFLREAFIYTRPGNDKRNVHPPREENAEDHKKHVNMIDTRAREVCNLYDEFVKLGRRILKV